MSCDRDDLAQYLTGWLGRLKAGGSRSVDGVLQDMCYFLEVTLLPKISRERDRILYRAAALQGLLAQGYDDSDRLAEPLCTRARRIGDAMLYEAKK